MKPPSPSKIIKTLAKGAANIDSPKFLGGMVPWVLGGMLVGVAVMNIVVVGDYENGILALMLGGVFLIDAKKWTWWKDHREALEAQLHGMNGVLHTSAEAIKAYLEAGDYEAVKRVADVNQMLAEAYLLSQSDFNVTVGTHSGEGA